MAVPKKDELLVPFATNASTRLTADYAAYQVTQAQAAKVASLLGPYVDAVDALKLAQAAGVRSKPLASARDAAKAPLVEYLRSIYALVQASTEVSDADKEALGIVVPKKPVSEPPPSEEPVFEALDRYGTTVVLGVHGKDTGRRPKYGATVSVFSYVGPTPPESVEEWTFEGSTSRLRMEVTFPASTPAGTTVWFCGFFANRKGESGPASAKASAVIAGGSMSKKA